MGIKEDILSLINAEYRSDTFLNDFTGAVTSVFDKLILFCESIYNNFFFDSLDEDGADWWENHLALNRITTQTLQDRRYRIRAKWLSKNKNNIELIQRVCNSWRNGEVEVSFIGGKYQIKFVVGYGIPSDFDSLKESIEDVKKAYLPYEFIYKYLLKKNIHSLLTKSQMQTYVKNQYCAFYAENQE